MTLDSLPRLVGAALALGAADVPGWSAAERALARSIDARPDVGELRERIRAGLDPLGDAFCTLRSALERRSLGQTYTSEPIVTAMVEWADDQGTPARVIDPGTGSARYLLSAGRRWPGATLVGCEIDPVAGLLARANLAAAGFAARSYVRLGDYRSMRPPRIDGRTLYIGNPPYVRHHQIPSLWKSWLLAAARERGLKGSALAGLHVHFFLATALVATSGDYGAYVTASEWLDTNYGSLVRDLLCEGLGGTGVHLVDPTTAPFSDAQTTAAITTFRVGRAPESLRLRKVDHVGDLGRLEGGREISRQRLRSAVRWSPLTGDRTKLPDGYLELGELCRVHRGAATGANKVFVVPWTIDELPAHVQIPAVTRAKELFEVGAALNDVAPLKRVIDLPVDLDDLDAADRRLVNRWLRAAEKAGARRGWIAQNRRAWWSVGMRNPAPILATYMARRPPTFVRNLANAKHLNIAHGLYPREPLSAELLDALAAALRDTARLADGRTYAGGLTKFEPREMERLPVPSPELLLST